MTRLSSLRRWANASPWQGLVVLVAGVALALVAFVWLVWVATLGNVHRLVVAGGVALVVAAAGVLWAQDGFERAAGITDAPSEPEDEG